MFPLYILASMSSKRSSHPAGQVFRFQIGSEVMQKSEDQVHLICIWVLRQNNLRLPHWILFPLWICFQPPNNVHFVHWIDVLVHGNQNRFQSKYHQNLQLVAPMQVLCSERRTCFLKKNHLKIFLNAVWVRQNWEEPQNLGYLYLNVLSGLSRRENSFISESPSHSHSCSWETCFHSGN